MNFENPVLSRHFPRVAEEDSGIVEELAVPAIEWLKNHKQITGDDVSDEIWKIVKSVHPNTDRRIAGSVFSHLKRKGLIVEIGTKLSDRLNRNHIPVWERTERFESEFGLRPLKHHVVWENDHAVDRWEE